MSSEQHLRNPWHGFDVAADDSIKVLYKNRKVDELDRSINGRCCFCNRQTAEKKDNLCSNHQYYVLLSGLHEFAWLWELGLERATDPID